MSPRFCSSTTTRSEAGTVCMRKTESTGWRGLAMRVSPASSPARKQEALKTWIVATLPHSTRQIGTFIEKEFGVVYVSRAGLIALLHRLGLEYHKTEIIPHKPDEEKQKAFIASYENIMNSLADNEAVLFVDAVHPTHAALAVGYWAPCEEKLAIEQTSGRQRINIHGAIDPETGQTRMVQAETADALSTIRLLESIEAFYPMLHSSMSFSTMHATITPNSCRNGSPIRGGGSGCISSRPIAPSQSDRTAMGPHAKACHAQQMLRHKPGVRRGDACFLA